jgi:hypothetical protein
MGALVNRCTVPPYDWVPYDAEHYRKRHGLWHILRKILSRWLPLAITGQHGLYRRHIPPASRVLWIHNGKPNFGDTLLELSGRRFLGLSADRSTKVDLWTLPHLAELFQGDQFFDSAYSDPGHINFAVYDFALLTELNHRSIRDKVRFIRHLPWTSLFDYFWGPDRNQALFSTAAVNERFSLGFSRTDLVSQAGPVLPEGCGVGAEPSLICFAIGGIDPKRSYSKWTDVMTCLDHLIGSSAKGDDDQVDSVGRTQWRVTLVGSDNGQVQAQRILSKPYRRLQVVSHVAEFSIKDTARVIQASRLFVGCDGGLLHVAHAVGVPSLSIFADERPELRLTQVCRSTPVRAEGPVDRIPPERLAGLIFELIQVGDKRLK